MNKDPNRKGKTIFDPFAGRLVETIKVIGSPEPEPEPERHTYEIFRACGECGGTGQCRRDHGQGVAKRPRCAQCLLGRHERGNLILISNGRSQVCWGKRVVLFAFELTDDEMRQLTPAAQLGARCEQAQHGKNRAIAKIAAEKLYEEKEKAKTVVRSWA